MKCCCWAIPRRTCPSLRRYSCSQAAWRPNKPGMPPSSHLATTAAVFIYQPITARLRNPAQRA